MIKWEWCSNESNEGKVVVEVVGWGYRGDVEAADDKEEEVKEWWGKVNMAANGRWRLEVSVRDN